MENEVKRRITLGTYVLSSGNYEDYYLKAQKARKLLTEEIHHIFREYHLIITPTTPTTAFKLGAIKDPFENGSEWHFYSTGQSYWYSCYFYTLWSGQQESTHWYSDNGASNPLVRSRDYPGGIYPGKDIRNQRSTD